MRTKPIAILLVLINTVFITIAQILFKYASVSISFDILSIITNYYLIFGILIYAFAAALLLVALKNGELSVLYPMVAASYIWVSIISPIFFPADSIGLIKWGGIFFIILGVSFLGLGGKNG